MVASEKQDIDLDCEISGRCVASAADRPQGVSQCRHCGKTLVLGPRGWLPWNHEDKRGPVVQDEV